MKSSVKLLIGWVLIGLFACSGDSYEEERTKITVSTVFKEAQSAFSNKDYATSIEKYSILIRENPKHYWLVHRRGQAYKGNGNFDKALRDFGLVIQNDPENKEQALLTCALIYQYELGNYDRAKPYYYEIIEYYRTARPQNSLERDLLKHTVSGAYSNLGRIAIEEKNYDEAITLFTQSIKLADSNFSKYYRAFAYYKSGDTVAAIEDYNNSIQVVKRHFVEDFPASKINQCDTCGFSFDSDEYLLLPRYSSLSLVQSERDMLDSLVAKMVADPMRYIDAALNNRDSLFIVGEDTLNNLYK